MEKARNIVVAVCTLAIAAFLWMQAGPQFMKMQAGAVTLQPGEELGQAQGQYVVYDAAYPVASCPEEYYTGDQSRVRTNGYVVYDAERKVFLYIVETDQSDGRYANLMYYLNLTADLRAEKDMSPAQVRGTLEPMDRAAIDRAVRTLEDSDVLDTYVAYQDSEAYYEVYFGDSYGQVMADMCQEISGGIGQAEWYRIDSGVINGVMTSDILICVMAAGLSLLIAVGSLISLFTGGKGSAQMPDSVGVMERFRAEQRVWVEDWCRYCRKRADRSAYLAVAIWLAVFLGIGILAKTPAERIFTFSLPLGVLLGEGTAVLLVWLQKSQSKPGKMLKRIEKRLRKAFPAPGALEAYAEDYLKAGKEWEFQERKKSSMIIGRLGDHCWSAFYGNGFVTLVDAEKLARVEPADTVGSVRSGKVRVGYESHSAKFYYEGTPAWEDGDKVFGFETRAGRDAFLALAAKKGAEGVKVREN
ncbi:MAG: hypothetical protein HFH92_12655 [Lachnospiraceae bacterium]|uniref:DUF6709 family protein n=1 Tax=uncultured Acetatifactor sp. TaxID=1671927 RepID=UPI0026016BF3|nr:DUF6709 family protein [uncultured Acetatifactor sp.]MCI8789940.1 hypothetical protein [Lachnospiraceae bacterium]